MSVTLDTSQFEMSPLNENAAKNMPSMSVTLDTSHLEMSPLNDDAAVNMLAMFVILDTSHFEMSPLNDDADPNVPRMLVTVDTSQFDISPLNSSVPGRRLLFASKNNRLISVTAGTCQDPIGPSGPLEQSVDNCRHCLMAFWSSALACGAQPMRGIGRKIFSVRLPSRERPTVRVVVKVSGQRQWQ